MQSIAPAMYIRPNQKIKHPPSRGKEKNKTSNNKNNNKLLYLINTRFNFQQKFLYSTNVFPSHPGWLYLYNEFCKTHTPETVTRFEYELQSTIEPKNKYSNIASFLYDAIILTSQFYNYPDLKLQAIVDLNKSKKSSDYDTTITVDENTSDPLDENKDTKDVKPKKDTKDAKPKKNTENNKKLENTNGTNMLNATLNLLQEVCHCKKVPRYYPDVIQPRNILVALTFASLSSPDKVLHFLYFALSLQVLSSFNPIEYPPKFLYRAFSSLRHGGYSSLRDDDAAPNADDDCTLKQASVNGSLKTLDIHGVSDESFIIHLKRSMWLMTLLNVFSKVSHTDEAKDIWDLYQEEYNHMIAKDDFQLKYIYEAIPKLYPLFGSFTIDCFINQLKTQSHRPRSTFELISIFLEPYRSNAPIYYSLISRAEKISWNWESLVTYTPLMSRKNYPWQSSNPHVRSTVLKEFSNLRLVKKKNNIAFNVEGESKSRYVFKPVSDTESTITDFTSLFSARQTDITLASSQLNELDRYNSSDFVGKSDNDSIKANNSETSSIAERASQHGSILSQVYLDEEKKLTKYNTSKIADRVKSNYILSDLIFKRPKDQLSKKQHDSEPLNMQVDLVKQDGIVKLKPFDKMLSGVMLTSNAPRSSRADFYAASCSSKGDGYSVSSKETDKNVLLNLNDDNADNRKCLTSRETAISRETNDSWKSVEAPPTDFNPNNKVSNAVQDEPLDKNSDIGDIAKDYQIYSSSIIDGHDEDENMLEGLDSNAQESDTKQSQTPASFSSNAQIKRNEYDTITQSSDNNRNSLSDEGAFSIMTGKLEDSSLSSFSLVEGGYEADYDSEMADGNDSPELLKNNRMSEPKSAASKIKLGSSTQAGLTLGDIAEMGSYDKSSSVATEEAIRKSTRFFPAKKVKAMNLSSHNSMGEGNKINRSKSTKN